MYIRLGALESHESQRRGSFINQFVIVLVQYVSNIANTTPKIYIIKRVSL